MNAMTEGLKQAMLKEKEAYESLLQLEKEKKEILIRNDIRALNEIIQKETLKLKEITSLNGDVTKQLQSLAEQVGLSSTVTLSQLLDALEESETKEFLSLKEEYASLIRDLGFINTTNQKLLETHLQYTGFCLELMTQQGPTGDIYSNTGYVTDAPVERFKLFDQEA